MKPAKYHHVIHKPTANGFDRWMCTDCSVGRYNSGSCMRMDWMSDEEWSKRLRTFKLSHA